MKIDVEVLGQGTSVVLVHGSLTTPRQTWQKQLRLADRWRLVLVHRRGYEPNPVEEVSDFEADGHDIAELLDGGAHLVGHSYGAVGALYAAATDPDAVRSLTLIEAPLMGLVRGEAAVEQQIERHEELLRGATTPLEFHRGILGHLGAPVDGAAIELPPEQERQVALLMHERRPWEAQLPEAVISAAFPILVITGGWDDVLEVTNDAVAEAFGPRAERLVLTGRGHVVQRLGDPFNDALERFLNRAEPASPR